MPNNPSQPLGWQRWGNAPGPHGSRFWSARRPTAITQLDGGNGRHDGGRLAKRHGQAGMGCVAVHVRNWHWLNGREDSPWYPTLRLFGQALGAWASAVTRLAKALRLIGAVEHNDGKREVLSDAAAAPSIVRLPLAMAFGTAPVVSSCLPVRRGKELLTACASPSLAGKPLSTTHGAVIKIRWGDQR